jgi:hypothetical protein
MHKHPCTSLALLSCVAPAPVQRCAGTKAIHLNNISPRAQRAELQKHLSRCQVQALTTRMHHTACTLHALHCTHRKGAPQVPCGIPCTMQACSGSGGAAPGDLRNFGMDTSSGALSHARTCVQSAGMCVPSGGVHANMHGPCRTRRAGCAAVQAAVAAQGMMHDMRCSVLVPSKEQRKRHAPAGGDATCTVTVVSCGWAAAYGFAADLHVTVACARAHGRCVSLVRMRGVCGVCAFVHGNAHRACTSSYIHSCTPSYTPAFQLHSSSSAYMRSGHNKEPVVRV